MSRRLPITFFSFFVSLVLINGAQAGLTGQQRTTHQQETTRISSRLESPDSIANRIKEILESRQGEFSFVVHFDYDKSFIRPEFQPLLDEIGKAVSGAPAETVELMVEGHTDWDGSDQYNVWLSEQRVRAVEKYFSERFDIRFRKTETKFWGESRPIRENTSREGMAYNRRAKFILRPAEGEAAYPPLNRFAVAYSHDGRYALSAGDRQTLKLWNADLDCRQRTLAGHFGKVLAAEFSPNGRLALSGAADNTARLWDIATGRQINTYYGHEGPVNTVAITADGLFAATGSDDRNLKLWHLVEDREIANLAGHEAGITAVDFSPNGWYAASGDRNGTVILWHVGRRTELSRQNSDRSPVSAIVFLDNKQFLTGNLKGAIELWDRTTGQVVRTFSKDGPAVYSADITPDGRFAVASGADGMVAIWNIATGKVQKQLKDHTSDVVFSAFSENSDRILTADSDLVHTLWDAETGQPIRSFKPIDPAAPIDVLRQTNATNDSIWQEPASGIELVRLAGRCYSMGCGTWTSNCSEDETPVHEVCIDDFLLGRTEVTQAQWLAIMKTNPSKKSNDGKDSVQQVSWYQAQDYVCRLNQITGLEFRLPTEAEWEFACRNNGDTVKYAADTSQSPGSGLLDMNGGLWEWLADIYEDNLNISVYDSHSRNNPLYTGSNDYRFSSAIYPRANRGGSWDVGDNPTRCSLRHYDAPDLRSFFTGFRVALPVVPPGRQENTRR